MKREKRGSRCVGIDTLVVGVEVEVVGVVGAEVVD